VPTFPRFPVAVAQDERLRADVVSNAETSNTAFQGFDVGA
jgi:hypothetical protein